MADTFVVRLAAGLVATVALDGRSEPEYEQLRWLTPLGQPALIVHRLAVHPRFQRRGLAKRLMQFAEEFAADRGLASIRLDAFSGNSAALALYEGLGYVRVGELSFPIATCPSLLREGAEDCRLGAAPLPGAGRGAIVRPCSGCG